MKFFSEKYTYLFVSVIIILFHQYIFQNFFPNSNLKLGHDYSFFLNNLMVGKIWFSKNFLSVPWFSPSFCCGLPFYPDPQNMFYSLQQLIFNIFTPVVALKIIFFTFSCISFLGTFLLINKAFNKNSNIAVLGATLFLFNTFLNYRIVIGHLSLISFCLLPLYCYFLFTSFEQKAYKLKSILNLILSSFIFSYFFYSGASAIIVILFLSISFIVCLYYFKKENFKIFFYFFYSVTFGLLLSLSKIISSLSYLKNFERNYEPVVFKSSLDYFFSLSKSLFFNPDLKFFEQSIINPKFNVELHEIEYGLSFLPLLILILCILNFKSLYWSKINKHKIFAILAMFFLTFFVFSLNINESFLTTFFQKLPIVENTFLYYRYNAIFILPIIIITCFLINNLKFIKNNSKIIFLFFISIIFLQNYFYDKSYYHSQNYDLKNIDNSLAKEKGISSYNIKKNAIMVDKNGKIKTSIQRNDYYLVGFSSRFCYQPIFGYKLENFPKNKMFFNERKRLDDDRFLITSDPKHLSNGYLNFHNPSCFLFPNENGCLPGDFFKKEEIKNLELFLNYKKFKFKQSKLQIISNYISVIILLLFIFFIIFYLFRFLLICFKFKT